MSEMQLLLSDTPVLGLPDVTTDTVCPGCYKVTIMIMNVIHIITSYSRFSTPGQVSVVLDAKYLGAVRSVWRARSRADFTP